jgi:major membrane immunogen (membrane-anchored lipoprotein)
MSKHLVPLLVGAALLVAGCGTASGGTGATGAPDAASSQTPRTRPATAPWPSYDVADYTYTLRTSCFCADRGVPVTVTVRDGKVTRASYAHAGWGHQAGDRAPDWLRVTINDVIDAARTPHAASVRVRWPRGQVHPTSVWVDPDANTADEEVGYTIRDVTPD